MVSRWILLGHVFIFISCSSKVEDTTSESSASTFEVVSVKALSFSTHASDQKWPDLKDSATVALEACTQDKIYVQSIVGEKFQIDTDLSSQNKDSNTRGCVSWKEEFKFDYLADETFFGLKARITNRDRYIGVQNLVIAINPWTKEVLYLNDGSVAQKISSFDSIQIKSITANLKLKSYATEVTNYQFFEDGSAGLNLRIQISPKILRRAMDGTSSSEENLSAGEFELTYELFKKQKGSVDRISIAKDISSSIIDEEGKIVDNIEFKIFNEIEINSVLEIAVYARARGTGARLGEASGHFIFESLKNPGSGVLSDFSQVKNTQFSSEKELRSGNHGLIIDRVHGILAPLSVGRNMDPSSMSGSIKPGIELSLVDSLVHEGVNSKFNILMIDGKTNQVIYDDEMATDERKNSGKLVFSPRIDFDENYEWDYREYIIEVKGLTAPLTDKIVKKIVYINPRVESSNFLLDSKPFSQPMVDGGNTPSLFVEEIGFEFLGRNEEFLYKVNKNLDLLSKRRMLFEFHPKLKMNHNYNGEQKGYSKLNSGSLNITFMLLTALNPITQQYNRSIDLKDFYVLTADKVDNVQVENGLVRVEMDLPHLFKEKPFMNYKNLAVIQIESSDENSLITPGHLIGTIEVFTDKGIIKPYMDSSLKSANELKLIASNLQLVNSAKQFVSSFQNRLQKDEEIDSRFEKFKDSLLSKTQLEKVTVLDSKKIGLAQEEEKYYVYASEMEFMAQNSKARITDDELQSLFDTESNVSSAIKKKFCKIFYDPKKKTPAFLHGSQPSITYLQEGKEYEACLESPDSAINFSGLKFMEKITKQPSELKDETGNMTVFESQINLTRNNAHFMTDGNMHQDANGMRYSLSHILGLHKYTSIFGVEAGYRTDKYSMLQDSRIVSRQQRFVNQDGISFGGTTVKAHFEAQYKKCVMVVPNWIRVRMPMEAMGKWDYTWYVLNEFFFEADNSVLITSPKRHLICKLFYDTDIVSDTWYFIKLKLNKSEGVADLSAPQNAVSTVIRGTKAYAEYREATIKDDEKFIVRRSHNEEIVKRYLKYMTRNGKETSYKDQLGVGVEGLIETNELDLPPDQVLNEIR